MEQQETLELTPDVMQRALQQIMRERGSVRTPKKAASSAENGRRGGRPKQPISALPCTCSAMDDVVGHAATCPRGRALKRRRKAEPESTLQASSQELGLC